MKHSLEDLNSLINALNDANVDVKRSAVEKLGQFSNARAAAALVTLLADDRVIDIDSEGYGISFSALASVALQEIGVPAIVALIPLLEDARPNVRYNATFVLGRIGRSNVVDPLIGRLGDEDETVRRTAAEALGDIGEWQAVEPLVAALNDPDKQVRRSVVEALGKLKDADSIPALEQAAQTDSEPAIAAQINFTIWEIRRFWKMIPRWADWEEL